MLPDVILEIGSGFGSAQASVAQRAASSGAEGWRAVFLRSTVRPCGFFRGSESQKMASYTRATFLASSRMVVPSAPDPRKNNSIDYAERLD